MFSDTTIRMIGYGCWTWMVYSSSSHGAGSCPARQATPSVTGVGSSCVVQQQEDKRLKLQLTQWFYFMALLGLSTSGSPFDPLAKQAFQGAIFYLDDDCNWRPVCYLTRQQRCPRQRRSEKSQRAVKFTPVEFLFKAGPRLSLHGPPQEDNMGLNTCQRQQKAQKWT